MSETALDPRVRGAVKDLERGAHPPAASGNANEAHADNLEKKLLAKMDARLGELRESTVEAAATLIAERVDALMESKVRKAMSGSFLAGTEKMKDAVLKVIQSVLLESGLLERFIQKAVESKIQGAQAGKAGAGAALGSREEIVALVQKEVSRCLSSEEVKMIMDDKFRAVSLYLKTDVIPKAINQAMKATSSERVPTPA